MDRFSRMIAWRYLQGKKKKRFSLINILNVMGITLGVFALLTVISVMNGFDRDIKEKILAFRSDVKIYSKDKYLSDYDEILKKLDNLQYLSASVPIIENELLIQSEDEIFGTMAIGIDFDRYDKSTKLLDKMVVGTPQLAKFNENGIILGMDLAVMLNVTAGEYIQLFSPIGSEPTPLGLLPKSRRFLVQGIFVSGIPEYDQSVSYISLKSAQFFSGNIKAVDFIEVRTINPDRSQFYKDKLEHDLPDDLRVEDWSKYEANLFNAMQMEKILMIVVLLLIIILAAFNIAGNLNRLVTEKRSDIGILKATGVKQKVLRKIVLLTGFYLGLLGTITGVILASGFLIAQLKWGFLKIPVAGFPINSIPVDIRIEEFIIIPLVALAIILIAGLSPANKINKMKVINIIRKK